MSAIELAIEELEKKLAEAVDAFNKTQEEDDTVFQQAYAQGLKHGFGYSVAIVKGQLKREQILKG